MSQGKKRSVQDHQLVAEVYSAALDSGFPPTRAVAMAFGVAQSSAMRYVVQARQKGFLPPTRPGVAKALSGKERSGGRSSPERCIHCGASPSRQRPWRVSADQH